MQPMTTPSGMVLLNKASGLTSFRSLGLLKKKFGTRKVGHAGTLDSFADGLMIACIGDATRLLQHFTGMDKTYLARIRWGVETDTLDPEGGVVSTGPVPDPEQFITVLPGFLGELEQVPPRYSAIHVDGKRAYQRTLSGEDFEIPSRNVHIHSLALESWSNGECLVSVSCSSGTYIRSLARDLGRACGTVASLSALRRVRIGPFRIEQAKSDPGPEDLVTGTGLAESLGSPAILRLHSDARPHFIQGRPLQPEWFDESDLSLLPDTYADIQIPVLSGEKIVGMIRYGRGNFHGYAHVFPLGI